MKLQLNEVYFFRMKFQQLIIIKSNKINSQVIHKLQQYCDLI
jgi:hypothetical protein